MGTAHSAPLQLNSKLCRDVFPLVARYLDASDVAHLLRVSKAAKSLCEADSTWLVLFERDAPEALEEVQQQQQQQQQDECSWKELYRRFALVRFSTEVGGEVSVSESGRKSTFPSSYGTVRSHKHYDTGRHFLALRLNWASVYAGVGVMPQSSPLPSAGRGAWLSSTNAWHWVANSGLWAEGNHVQHAANAAYHSGDVVGVLLDLREPYVCRVAWYVNGHKTDLIMVRKRLQGDGFVFSVCLGGGSAEVVSNKPPELEAQFCAASDDVSE